MDEALAEYWPEECRWTLPEGGLFLYARLPKRIDTEAFLRTRAIRERVAYVPGVHFYPNSDGGTNAMRLNFSYSKPETTVEGIRRLGAALKKELANS
jgi:2-aminoadipate transaminase